MGKIYAVSEAISRYFSRPSKSLAMSRYLAWACAFNVLVGMGTLPLAITIGDPLLGTAIAAVLMINTAVFRIAARRYATAKVEADFAREADLIFARLKLDFNRE
ncbi:hypothetical protein BN1051_03010 [Arthrobacter saudimassiliensis]|uniref:Uncharacterized protein n=1 Tax=Arthrobacter saudimassiliensis TaxID=1461584 RepID=A0A078MR30_9MICC|nr:hypothetical protein BN1051_03010 [Arthrobacter saudimassiliensis]